MPTRLTAVTPRVPGADTRGCDNLDETAAAIRAGLSRLEPQDTSE
ncbi:hypothetical protein [Frankia sp. Cppng1_Ct_nod]|nr:hypothetical protein [Frankia sp. Cppng1_Ct_nod]